MYDRQTESLWSQLLSFSVKGEFEGTQLELIPLTLTTWEQWSAENPETIALRKPSASSQDQYEGYYLNNRAGVIGEDVEDDRLPRKELVLGVGFDAGPKAYPHSALSETRLVNDLVADEHVAIYYHPESGTALAYSAEADGMRLSFELDHDEGRDWLVDSETGTRWLAFSGQAVEGPLAGERLQRVHSVKVFWFAWTDFYPETDLFEHEPSSDSLASSPM